MPGLMFFPHTQITAPSTATWWILATEQWEDSFQITEGQTPMRLKNKLLEFWIRPDFDHPRLVKKLSSDPNEGGEIRIDDEDQGFVTIIVPQSIVARDIEPTITQPWKYFLRALDRGPGFAWRPQEIVRGEFWCHPGLTTQ
ncbi:MAG: hypothetical protein E6G97_07455 [Alphaproteobacteria bacterium]|nr:MAG: hypothetical protein E6G97_07455 [Alphaproteobacteria bacterium]